MLEIFKKVTCFGDPKSFFPFQHADNFVFQGARPSEKYDAWACLDHQHLLTKNDRTHFYENPPFQGASQTFPKFTLRAPFIRLGSRAYKRSPSRVSDALNPEASAISAGKWLNLNLKIDLFCHLAVLDPEKKV